jgi:hypothetical protein
MNNDNDHRDADRYGRGRSRPKPGTGAYTSSRTCKQGDDPGKDEVTGIDRSDSPQQKPYGSGYYPHAK